MDAEVFKKKCRDKTSQFKSEGKTIVFVSHALNTAEALCQGSLLLNKGRVARIGNTEQVIVDRN